MTRIFATIAAVFIACGPLLASHCAQPARVVQKQAQQYHVQQQVQKYGHAQFQQIYYPPYHYEVGADLKLEALAEKVARRIEAKLIEREAIEQKQQPTGLKVLTQKCANCHSDGSRYVVDKDAPAFFDKGKQLKQLSVEDLEAMALAARLGNMPPPPAKELLKRDAQALEDYLFPEGLPSEQEEPESVIRPKAEKKESE